MRRDGTPRQLGGRRGMCNTSEVYREYSVGIARRMAERYGQRETITGWQIDNELMGPCDHDNALTECHCAECTLQTGEGVTVPAHDFIFIPGSFNC